MSARYSLLYKTIQYKFLNKAVYLILFSIASLPCNGQNQKSNYAEIIKEQVKAMGDCFVNKNLQGFIKFTYPPIVAMVGGEENMMSMMESKYAALSEKGLAFESSSYGSPSEIISYENELQCTLPQTLVMKTTGYHIIIRSTLIAISINHGQTWYFIDSNGQDLKTMQNKYPNLSNDLLIPGKIEPEYIEDK